MAQDRPRPEESCDAFGYTAYTLDGLIAALTRWRDAHPEMANQAVYVPSGRVYQPVDKLVSGRGTVILGLPYAS